MSLQFKLRNGKVVIDPDYLAIKEFKDLYDLDTTKEKDIAARMFTVVYMLADEESHFRSMKESDKWAMSIENAQLKQEDVKRGSKLIEEASYMYASCNNTPLYRALLQLRREIDKLTHRMSETEDQEQEVEINIGTKTNPQIIKKKIKGNTAQETAAMADLLFDLVEKEQKMSDMYQKKKDSGELRAGKQPSDLAKGKFKNPVKDGSYTR